MNGKQAKRGRLQAKLGMARILSKIHQEAQEKGIPHEQVVEAINGMPSVRQFYRRMKRVYVRSPH